MAACGSGEITQEEYDAERERLLGKKTPSGAGGGEVRQSLPLQFHVSCFMFPVFYVCSAIAADSKYTRALTF
jgi:hypothetical protein